MTLGVRGAALVACALLAEVVAFPRTARAGDGGGPCGNFEFAQGVSCQIEVSEGCTADCTPLKLEAGCTGGCSTPPDPGCSNPCETTCTSSCSPTALDCMTGCHGECDQQMTTTCQQQDPTADCVSQSKAQCDVHCQQACSSPAQDCTQVCHTCCDGSCSAQINFSCDFQCFANLQGGCKVQCQQPAGAMFCNGQYVGASDVQACVTYLASQGITVDVSARGSALCDANGCHAAASVSASGCAVSRVTRDVGSGGVGLAGLVLASAGARAIRRRARASGRRKT